ncbi:hypothetical protein GTO91_00715 [Heliobacterium undosum]|uniref:Uncharacterized protein n=1 Tax=Heliomicrobium undosum TaxID=121734 RepID=A0A845L0I2_9FIRM|nr:hypothetical protein [Heliomicrobium undosum]MZP28244.1 hypothetical protein [Heliomicrobium undosum]
MADERILQELKSLKDGQAQLTQMVADLVRIVGNTNAAVEELRQDVDLMKQEMGVMRQDIDALRQDMNVMRQDMNVMRRDIDSLKVIAVQTQASIDDIRETQEDQGNLLDLLALRVSHQEAKILGMSKKR